MSKRKNTEVNAIEAMEEEEIEDVDNTTNKIVDSIDVPHQTTSTDGLAIEYTPSDENSEEEKLGESMDPMIEVADTILPNILQKSTNIDQSININTSLPSTGILNSTVTSTATQSVIKRSKTEIRKPLTAWMIYANEKRPILMQNHPNLSFIEIGKLLGEGYRNINPDELNRLTLAANKDKERYIHEMKIYELMNPEKPLQIKKLGLTSDLIIPSGRVKRILKLDPDVKSIGKEATIALTRATELFIQYLANKSFQAASAKGLRTIKDVDIVHSIHTKTNLEFLRLDFPKKTSNAHLGDNNYGVSSTIGSGGTNHNHRHSLLQGSNRTKGSLSSTDSMKIGTVVPTRQAITSFFSTDENKPNEPSLVPPETMDQSLFSSSDSVIDANSNHSNNHDSKNVDERNGDDNNNHDEMMEIAGDGIRNENSQMNTVSTIPSLAIEMES